MLTHPHLQENVVSRKLNQYMQKPAQRYRNAKPVLKED